MREHSRLELMRKIQARGYGADDAEVVLDQLEREGALDAGRLVEHYVSERAAKGFGPLRIGAELRVKGLADDLIDGQLSAMQDAWPQYLAKAHERRFRGCRPVDRAELAKQARFLDQRGFPTETVLRFLRFDD
ncbi:regulatory protein RecX [Thiorhodococcus mannitoliphagus]|uniref:Regulatory protein RecX n=2 Tax=Thiorhodococcus mannitoliphagus TaxID=329406 RepID=A0A6P1E027_9GAMM|nr:regulatory protein RecX [Thiorhodococcus mannitoliphagus]